MKGQCRYKYLVIRRDRSYFAKKTLRFYEKVLRKLYHQNARFRGAFGRPSNITLFEIINQQRCPPSDKT
jgi:hypothetical protein